MRAAKLFWFAGPTAAVLLACGPGTYAAGALGCRKAATRRRRTRAVVALDELLHFGIDLLAPPASREDAVVACADGVVMKLARFRDPGAQRVRSPRLAGARDVVEFPFDGEQRAARDVLG